MSTGTSKVIGFLMSAQRPLNEYYLNEGVAWVDSAAVLAGIPIGSRSDGLLVKIGTELWWFKADLTTLEKVPVAAATSAALVSLLDAAALYDSTDVEAALAEVMTKVNATNSTVSAMGSIKQSNYTITLPASSSVAGRIAGAVETTDYPTGWTLSADSGVNLLVTHTLTGRKVSGVNVFEIDGANERLLPPFSEAYSGILVNGLTVKIEGLAPTLLAIRVEIFVNL